MRVPPVVRKISLYLLLGLGALVLASVLTATLFERQIGERILRAVDEQLDAELEVRDFDLSFLDHFPNLSAGLRGVSLLDAEGGLLMQADRLAFNLSLLSFITANYDLYSVEMSDGVLHLRWDESGRPNYDILRPEAPGTYEYKKGESLAFSLRQARLYRVEMDFEHAGSRQRGKLRLEEARFSGDFSARQFNLESWANGTLGFIELDDRRFLVNQPLEYRSDLLVDGEEERYAVQDLALRLGSSEVGLRGEVRKVAENLDYDLTLRGDRVELTDVLDWLPVRWREDLRAYRAAGLVSLQGRIAGAASPGNWPPTRIRLDLRRGRLQGPLLADDLKDLAFSAAIEHREGEPARLRLDAVRGYFGRQLIEGTLALEDWEAPRLDLQLNGILPLESLYPILAAHYGHPAVDGGLGTLELRNLQVNARGEMQNGALQWRAPSFRGQVALDDAGLRIRGEAVRFDRGILSFAGDRLDLQDLRLEGPGTNLSFAGTAVDVMPWLLGVSDPPVASVTGRLSGRALDIGQWLALAPLAAGEDDDPRRTDSLARRRIQARSQAARHLRGAVELDLDALRYRQVEITGVRGQVALDSSVLSVGADASSMAGTCRLDGSLSLTERPNLNARIRARDIELGEAFRQMEDFGQTWVSHRNIDGRLSTQMVLDAAWDSLGRFAYDRLAVKAAVAIADGELNGLRVLDQFADYVDIQDLRNLRFADLEHYLEIRNETVSLPVLFLQSNALNLSVNGRHRFDGSYRYNLKVNAGQVLTDRFRAHDPSLEPKPARRKGFFNLYYTLRGDAESIRVEKARREVREDFARSRQRLERIRAALREAFGEALLIGEPEDWKDGGAGEEFLDFDLSGGG